MNMMAYLMLFQKERAKRVFFGRYNSHIYAIILHTYIYLLLSFQKEKAKREALRSFFVKLPQALEKYDDLQYCIKHMGSDTNARRALALERMCSMHTCTIIQMQCVCCQLNLKSHWSWAI